MSVPPKIKKVISEFNENIIPCPLYNEDVTLIKCLKCVEPGCEEKSKEKKRILEKHGVTEDQLLKYLIEYMR